MALRIVHISDWHGQFYKLPEADAYFVTGDMLDNYPNVFVKKEVGGWGTSSYLAREIVPDKERRLQWGWYVKKFVSKNRTLRHFLGSPDAPVYVVRGNHDFIDLAPLFHGEVYEIADPTVTYDLHGLRVGGFRGINYIAGEWSDEMQPEELYAICEKLPRDLDVVLTHTPPLGIRDGACGEKYGSTALAGYINDCLYEHDKVPRLFCFGHVHNDRGIDREKVEGTTFSNAATTHQVIDLEI